MSAQPSTLEFHSLTPDRWPDLAQLFGPRGACAGCWCMWWRIKRSEWEQQRGEGNREAFRAVVEAGALTGILAYSDGKPAGWCAVAPRDTYTVLERSRTLKRIDDQPVWSVTCFFVARPFRRQGLMERLLAAAVDHARDHGAQIVEGYPIEPRQSSMPDAFAYTGLAATFRKIGFVEAARRSETRPIMRYLIGEQPS